MAETTLRADGIQDLADQIPDLLEAAVGNALEFLVRVRFGGETPLEPDAVNRVNALFTEVSEELKLKLTRMPSSADTIAQRSSLWSIFALSSCHTASRW